MFLTRHSQSGGELGKTWESFFNLAFQTITTANWNELRRGNLLEVGSSNVQVEQRQYETWIASSTNIRNTGDGAVLFSKIMESGYEQFCLQREVPTP